jgi:exosome complex component RRP45
MGSTYVAIRDDSGLRSLSVNERDFLRSCALKNATTIDDDDDDFNNSKNKILRIDGRGANDVRKVRLHLGRRDNEAECTVQWGVGTRVTSLCSAELVPPSPDRPNEGIVNFTVDLSPMATSSFKLAPAIGTGTVSSSGITTFRGSNYSDQSQRLLSNRILRCIERIVLIGGALDTEALVLEGGKWVWRFTVALTVLDAGGNILDACVLAAMAALRHYRKPQVDLSSSGGTGDESLTANYASNNTVLPTMIPSTIKEATPLPLHHTPLSISFGLIPADDAVNSATSTSIVAALIDPTDREELVQSGSLTVAMNVHSEVCLLDYGGGCELTPSKLKECWRVAEVAIKDLCQLLETTLTQADEQAQNERLRLLQLQQQVHTSSLPPLPSASSNKNTPFLQQIEDMDVDSNVDETQVQQAQREAEEAYRKQALDYSSGRKFQKV